MASTPGQLCPKISVQSSLPSGSQQYRNKGILSWPGVDLRRGLTRSNPQHDQPCVNPVRCESPVSSLGGWPQDVWFLVQHSPRCNWRWSTVGVQVLLAPIISGTSGRQAVKHRYFGRLARVTFTQSSQSQCGSLKPTTQITDSYLNGCLRSPQPGTSSIVRVQQQHLSARS